MFYVFNLFDWLAISIPLILFFLIAMLINKKEKDWRAFIGKNYFSLLILLPPLSLSIITFIYTKNIDLSKINIELGNRQLHEKVDFRFNIVRNINDYDLQIGYTKTPETITPKNIKMRVFPILFDHRTTPKKGISLDELKSKNVHIYKDKMLENKNSCVMSNIRADFDKTDLNKSYLSSDFIKWEGIAIEFYYNDIPNIREPLHEIVTDIFPR
jgi:hypothetical protein